MIRLIHRSMTTLPGESRQSMDGLTTEECKMKLIDCENRPGGGCRVIGNVVLVEVCGEHIVVRNHPDNGESQSYPITDGGAADMALGMAVRAVMDSDLEGA